MTDFRICYKKKIFIFFTLTEFVKCMIYYVALLLICLHRYEMEYNCATQVLFYHHHLSTFPHRNCSRILEGFTRAVHCYRRPLNSLPKVKLREKALSSMGNFTKSKNLIKWFPWFKQIQIIKSKDKSSSHHQEGDAFLIT